MLIVDQLATLTKEVLEIGGRTDVIKVGDREAWTAVDLA
jgi:hypothetical protein